MLRKPEKCEKQDLIYKDIESKIYTDNLTFYPPIVKKFDKAPVLFLIPGGGWQRNDSIHMYNMARLTADKLGEQGFAVVSATYRGLVADGITVRETVVDILDALSFLARYSDVLEIDPDRIYTMGHSAGAHLSLMAAYLPYDAYKDVRQNLEKFTVAGVVGLASPLYFPAKNMDLYYPAVLTDIFDGYTAEDKKELSPITYANKDSAPTLLIHGNRDQLVYAVQSDMLYQKLKDCGVKAELIICNNGEHSFLPVEPQKPVMPDLPYALNAAAEFIMEVNQSKK